MAALCDHTLKGNYIIYDIYKNLNLKFKFIQCLKIPQQYSYVCHQVLKRNSKYTFMDLDYIQTYQKFRSILKINKFNAFMNIKGGSRHKN